MFIIGQLVTDLCIHTILSRHFICNVMSKILSPGFRYCAEVICKNKLPPQDYHDLCVYHLGNTHFVLANYRSCDYCTSLSKKACNIRCERRLAWAKMTGTPSSTHPRPVPVALMVHEDLEHGVDIEDEEEVLPCKKGGGAILVRCHR